MKETIFIRARKLFQYERGQYGNTDTVLHHRKNGDTVL